MRIEPIKNDEQIVKEYKPKSFRQHIFYPLDKRTALVITTKRVIFHGMFPFLDKEIPLCEISDVILDGDAVRILQKGKTPWEESDNPFTPGGYDEKFQIFVGGWIPAKEVQRIINKERQKLNETSPLT